MRVEVTKRAQREVNRLGRWWLENRDKAPELFEEELSATYFGIAMDPSVGKLYTISRDRRILRVLTGKTKNYVYYCHSSGVGLGCRARPWSQAVTAISTDDD